MTTRFRIHVRDRPVATGPTSPARMKLIGEIDHFLSFEATAKHLDVGSWVLTMPADSPQASLIKAGRGIVLFLDSSPNDVAFSGAIRKIVVTKNESSGGQGILTVSGVCDNYVVGERLGRISPVAVYAREDEAARFWFAVVHAGGAYRQPLNSGEFIWGLLVANVTIPVLTEAADESRRVRYVAMPEACPASLIALPPDEDWKRFPMTISSIEEAVWYLADLLNLEVRFQYNPATELIEPVIRPVQDVSETVVFDELAGNLIGYEVTTEAPNFTRLFIAGKTPTEENGRRYYEYWRTYEWNPPGWSDYSTPGSTPEEWDDQYWGRKAIEVEWNVVKESYLDVRESDWAYQSDPADPGAALDPPENSNERRRIDRQREAAFVENSARGLISLEVQDTKRCQYGIHYRVGETVRVLLNTAGIPESMLDTDGVVRRPVQEVKFSCSADDMWKIEPVVGTSDSTPYVYRQLKRLRRRVEQTKNRVA